MNKCFLVALYKLRDLFQTLIFMSPSEFLEFVSEEQLVKDTGVLFPLLTEILPPASIGKATDVREHFDMYAE